MAGLLDIAEEVETAPQPPATTSLSDLTEEVQPAAPTTRERVRAVGKGITGGLVQGIPAVAGAVAGGQIGAAVGAFGGPFAPVTVPLGIVIGGITGLVAGGMAGAEAQRLIAQVEIPGTGETLTFESMEAVPPDLRPYAVVGETFGASLGFTGAPLQAARTGFRFSEDLVGRTFNSFINTAARNPATFAGIEISSAQSAALAGGVAEAVDPGAAGTRVVSEVVGGIANPTRWTVQLGRSAVEKGLRTLRSFSASGREDAAAQVLQDIVREAGEDPQALIGLIKARRAELPGLDLTAGQLTGSPTLQGLETRLAQESAKFGSDSKAMAEQSLDTIRVMIKTLETHGSPEALKQAAALRGSYFQTLLSSRLHEAERAAMEAAAKIDPSNVTSRAEYGRQVFKIMDEALTSVRTAERELWGKVEKDVPGFADSILARFDDLKAERLPEESLPPIVEGFVRRMRGEDAISGLPEDVVRLIDNIFGSRAPASSTGLKNIPTDSGELMRFRSRMLALSRESAAKNEWSDARVFGELADAALDDLSKLQFADIVPAAGRVVTKEAVTAYGAARDYSRRLHDTFSRTFAGTTQDVQRSGEARIPPEMLMRRAFAAGGEVGELHFRQLEEAAVMAGREHASQLLDLQERTIRFAAAEIIDPMTDRVNPKRLARFVKNNADLLNRFPEVRNQLNDAVGAEKLLQRTIERGRLAEKAIRQNTAFSRVLNGENPTIAVRRSLTGDNPEREFAALIKLARRGGVQAEDGLRAAAFTHLFDNSVGRTGEFSFAAYKTTLDTPVTPGGRPLKELMKDAGVLTDDLDKLSTLLNRAIQIEDALKGGRRLDEVLPDEGPIVDFVNRYSGARLAANLPGSGGSSIIIAGAGAKFSQQVFAKLPKQSIRKVLMEASRDPEFMAILLAKPKTPVEKLANAQQLNSFLWQIGVTSGPDVFGDEEFQT